MTRSKKKCRRDTRKMGKVFERLGRRDVVGFDLAAGPDMTAMVQLDEMGAVTRVDHLERKQRTRLLLVEESDLVRRVAASNLLARMGVAASPISSAVIEAARIQQTVKEMHRRAMDQADKGDKARKQGDEETATQHFLHAVSYERAALALTPSHQQPNHAVLLRSAASLAIDANQPVAALELLTRGIENPETPREILREMVDLAVVATGKIEIPR